VEERVRISCRIQYPVIIYFNMWQIVAVNIIYNNWVIYLIIVLYAAVISIPAGAFRGPILSN